MESTQVINDLKAALANQRKSGYETVDITALEKYLNALPFSTTKTIELQKIETQHTLAQLDAKTKHDIEMFKAVIESGREALNALVLINVGAVIALLGFMGATISKGLPQALGLSLSLPILLFGIGVLMGAIGFAIRYFSQASYSANDEKWGCIFKATAIAIASVGYSLFGWGIYLAFRAFSIQFTI